MPKKVYLDFITGSFERTVLLAACTVILMLCLASSAFATVKSYVFPSMYQRKIALEDSLMTPRMISTVETMMQVETTPVESGSSLTQGILYQAALEYESALTGGEQTAMTRMLEYLERSGVSTELANILIEEISNGRYDADARVISGLKTMASSAK